jgi:UDP-N-acetylglucosamine 2-epimerase (non-hydrolysing)
MGDAKFLDKIVPKKTGVVVGTRPGIIKMSPIISELENHEVESFTLHAGQHYSHNLDNQIFDDLGLSKPKHRVEGISETEYHGEQTAAMIEGIEKILLDEKPENVLVCADANFNLAGALATRKLRLNLGHVEAGLRSNDWRMPEEHNRVMIDHISEWLFVPTMEAYENAIRDNVQGEVVLTGNTIVDAIQRNLNIASENSNIRNKLKIDSGEYIILTSHREENVDNKETLNQITEVIDKLSNKYDKQIIYPIHPRTKKRLRQFELRDEMNNIDSLVLIDALGYLDFLKLLSGADFVLTDSGGIQEESCILQIPCVTLRENTERPETVQVGSNIISGTQPDSVLQAIEEIRNRPRNWENPFGDGDAAEKIVNTVIDSKQPI